MNLSIFHQLFFFGLRNGDPLKTRGGVRSGSRLRPAAQIGTGRTVALDTETRLKTRTRGAGRGGVRGGSRLRPAAHIGTGRTVRQLGSWAVAGFPEADSDQARLPKTRPRCGWEPAGPSDTYKLPHCTDSIGCHVADCS